MTKKDVKRIKEIFAARQERLINAIGHLAMDLKYECIDKEYYDREMEEFDSIIYFLNAVKSEILEGVE